MSKLTQQEKNQSAAIMHAVEIESSFKLYSYRIISHEQFVSRVTELTQLFQKNISENG